LTGRKRRTAYRTPLRRPSAARQPAQQPEDGVDVGPERAVSPGLTQDLPLDDGASGDAMMAERRQGVVKVAVSPGA